MAMRLVNVKPIWHNLQDWINQSTYRVQKTLNSHTFQDLQIPIGLKLLKKPFKLKPFENVYIVQFEAF